MPATYGCEAKNFTPRPLTKQDPLPPNHHDVVRLHLRSGALVLASGAGAEMRQSLGTAVFSGMIGVTLFGIFLTPVFFFGLSWLGGRQPRVEGPPDGSSKQPAAETVEGDGSAATNRPKRPLAHRPVSGKHSSDGLCPSPRGHFLGREPGRHQPARRIL